VSNAHAGIRPRNGILIVYLIIDSRIMSAMKTQFTTLILSTLILGSLMQCGNLPSDPDSYRERSAQQANDTGKYYAYPWLDRYKPERKILNQIHLPAGYQRPEVKKNTFAHWLQNLPISTEQEVHLYNGALKHNQDAQFLVLDVDVGSTDLQQCADACMRLRAEYLFSIKTYNKISFNFTSGFKAEYKRWAEGERISIEGNNCKWVKKTQPDYSYATFRKYLDLVFMYAGTQSLSQELVSIPADSLKPGDLFIKGGFPGHAVMVMDVAKNSKGEKIFTLAQSYMPAQQIHILKNPDDDSNPWYHIEGNVLETPEWTFEWSQVKRWKF
jgi:hypothetical protein